MAKDLPPEYCHYRDEGCELAPSCLSCPFSSCLYEEPAGQRRWRQGVRSREMHRMFFVEGKRVGEIARRFGVSERTVQRAIRTTKQA